MNIRFSLCIQTAIVLLLLTPYVALFVPGGGQREQAWLNQVVAHLEQKSKTCTDPGMKEMIDYTVRRYNYVGPFGVKVVQLSDDILGINIPFCRGVTLDEELVEGNIPFGASVLVHEAMHDHFPFFGHSHIDDTCIWKAVK